MSFNDWKKVKLKDCVRFQEGYVNPSQSITEYFGNEIKWLRANDLNNSFVYDTSRKLSRKGFESAGKSALLFEPNSLAISKSGTIGRLGILKDYMCGNRAVINIAINNDISDMMFVFYSLLFRQGLIEQMGSGSVQKNLYISVLGELEIDLPPISIQRRIASILSALDEKIDINRQINTTLESLIQTIFKEWFIEFNYPEAKTNQMVESPLGLIPKTWRVGKLGDIIEAKGGTTPSTKEEEYWDGEYYFATPKDLSSLKSPVLLDTERKITQEGVSQISSGILPKDTLLLSSRAPIGYLAITNIPVSINQGFIAINAKETSNLFILYWLKENMDTVISRANGSTFLEITKTNFREIELVIPDATISKHFDELVNPIFEQIKNNEQEIATLTSLRDALMPKLMNGEIEL